MRAWQALYLLIKLHPQIPKTADSMCLPAQVWSPEVNFECLSTQLPSLVLETEPLNGLGAHCFS